MSLSIVKTQNEEKCAEALADALAHSLYEGKKTLWLIPGGSNIKIAVATLNKLFEKVEPNAIDNLKITLTDERYGPVGHKDSNWQQMIDAGFAFSDVSATPLLVGLPLKETVAAYGKNITELFAWADAIIAQFGIGADGHIGGMLPHTVGVDSNDVAVGYESAPFVRISISLKTMQKIHSSYAFVFGESKKEALVKLTQDGSLEDIPSRVLKLIPESYLYTDQDIPN